MRLRLLQALEEASEAEMTAHSYLYDSLSDSEMLALFGRQLLANHRELRSELTSLVDESRTLRRQLGTMDDEEE